jgi:hypothetical protein
MNGSERKIRRAVNEAKKLRREMMLAVNAGNGPEIKVNGVQTGKTCGVIYLIEHEMFNGWVKCGMTTNMISRLVAYNCSDPLKRFKAIVQKEVNDRRKAETLLIHNLSMTAAIQSGEWFKIDRKEALAIFNAI